MPTLTHEEVVAQRFLQNIGVKLMPKQVPIATTKSEPPAPPQPVKETKPVDRQAEFAKRFDAELDAQVELERHPDLFDSSEGGMENVARVLEWIQQRGEYPSRATVADAIRALKGELLPLFKPEPVSQPKIAQAQPVVPRPPQSVVSGSTTEPVDDLPPLPDYVKRVLGSNKLRNRADVRAIPSQLYSDLYRGAYADAFRKRVNAALAR